MGESTTPPVTRAAVARLAGVALAYRLFFLWLIRYLPNDGDSPYYLRVASNIAAGHGHTYSTAPPYVPVMYRSPLYPAFLAVDKLLFGDSILAMQISQCVVSTLTVLVLWRAVSKINPRAGTFVGWALALSPFEATYAGAILSECLVGFFLALGLSAPVLWRGTKGWIVAGISLALGALTRDVYMLMMFGLAGFAALFGAFTKSPWRARIVGPAVLVLAGICTIAPWTARNYAVSGHFIPISRGVFARAMWFGTWVVNYDHVNNDPNGHHLAIKDDVFHLPGEKEKFWTWVQSEDEVERDRVFMQMFKDRVAAEPGTVAYVYVRRSPQIWVGTSRTDAFWFRPAILARTTIPWWILKALFFGLNFSCVLLGFYGAIRNVIKRRWNLVWFALPMFYTVAVFLPIDCLETRYTQPVFPFVVVMASFLLAEIPFAALIGRLRRRRPDVDVHDGDTTSVAA